MAVLQRFLFRIPYEGYQGKQRQEQGFRFADQGKTGGNTKMVAASLYGPTFRLLFPWKRTSEAQAARSALGHNRTRAAQQY